MPGYKLIVKNAKVILKTVTNAVLNISGIKDLLTGSGSLDSNNKIDWTLQEYTNTAANFTSNNPILLLGQKGIETDDLLTAPKFKIGNGVTAWNSLPYANSGGGGGGGVPYTGATANVDLGEYELKAGQIELDQTPTGTAGVAVMQWNNTDGTLDLGLKGGLLNKIGQQVVVRARNNSGSAITKGSVVKVIGVAGGFIGINLALGDSDANSATAFGIVAEDIADASNGFVSIQGIVHGLNTNSFTEGDVLYLSPTVAGTFTNVKPVAPQHAVVVGYVAKKSATDGHILMHVQNGYELDELHNVYINPSTLANNDVLTYDSASSLWKNKQSNYLQIVSKDITDSAPLTGTTSITLMKSILIPANTYATGDVVKILSRAIRNTFTGLSSNLLYINTTNSLTGATLVGTQTAAVIYYGLERTLYIKSSTNTETINSSNSVSGSEAASFGFASSNLNIDWTVNQYIIAAFKNSAVGDSTVMSSLIIQKY